MLSVSDEETESSETRCLEEVKNIVQEWHQFRIVRGKKSTRIITIHRKVALAIQGKLFEEYKQQWKETGNHGELLSGQVFTDDQIKEITETICKIEITNYVNR